MAKVLVVGKPQAERDGLVLVLEFAGHECATADSTQEAAKLIPQKSFDLVLADTTLGVSNPSEFVRSIKQLSSGLSVMVLTDDAQPTRSESAITHPYSPTRDLATDFSAVGRKEAFMVLLPEPESFRRMSGLPQTAGMLNKLAVLYHSQRKYRIAEQLYKKALKVTEAESGKQTTEVATILNNVARLYHDQDRLEDAEPLYKRSLAIVEKVAGPKTHKAATRLRNLVELYRAQGRNDEAATLNQKLMGIRE
jgi:CheY-like chemotaxis protein